MRPRSRPGALRRAVGIVAAVALAAMASAGDESPLDHPGQATSSDGALRILEAVSHPTHGAPVGVVYLRIENRGPRADRLVSVASSASRHAQLHETVREGDTVKMEHRAEIEVPAGGALALAPGGLHIMLMGLREPLRAGQTLPLRLGFANAGILDVSVPVVPNDPSA